MNFNLYGHAGQWLLVDCGMGFDHSEPREKRVAADPSFIEQYREGLQAIVITHAHEDHLGAILEFWPRLQAPVYATPFAAQLLMNKLSRVTWGHAIPIHEVQFRHPYDLGVFELTWLEMPHSVPESSCLLIETEVGKVLHTGDWKMDKNPVIGQPFDKALYQAVAEMGVDAMICDSTNAVKEGTTLSESACYAGLYEAISQQKNRVVVGCFSSNIARLVTIAKIAKKVGRQVGLLGRSMETLASIAKRLGYWPEGLSIIDPKHIGYLPKEEVLVIATGSQAEPRAALTRMAKNQHPLLYLEAQDTVIFSATKIPPNKERINQLITTLESQEIQVVHAEDYQGKAPLHASGHPSQEDLRALLAIINPKMLIPTHGEAEHLQALYELAQDAGVEQVLQGKNGDLFQIAPFAKVTEQFVAAGRVELTDI